MKLKKSCRCNLECKALTGKKFAQGHDARLVSTLVKAVKDGLGTPAEAETELLIRGGSPKLATKLANALANTNKKRTRKTVTA